MEYVSRDGWDANNARRRDKIGDVFGIGVHYTWEPSGTDDHPRCPHDVRTVQNAHMNGRGWSDIAYSWLVCRHGTIFEGRGWGIRTAANGTNWGNEHFHAVCVITSGAFSSAAKRAVNEVISEHGRRYQRNEVKGHRDFKATGCPGDEGYAWLRAGRPLDNQPPAPQPDPNPTPPSPDAKWVSVNVNLPVLRRGHDGQHVEALQNLLRIKGGQRLAADGDFGPATHDAVLAWQRFFGLAADGIVGEKTWATLITLPI